MNAVSFVMVLMGCGQGDLPCERIATLPVAYSSQASCLAARPEILAASTGLGFARVEAECRSAVPASASGRRSVRTLSTS